MNNQNGPFIVTPAASDPVTVSDVQAYCLVDPSTDGPLISSLITAATDYVQRLLGQQLMTATLRQTWDSFHVRPIYEHGHNNYWGWSNFSNWHGCGHHHRVHLGLDIDPVTAVNSVKYYDLTGTQQTLVSDQYWADNEARHPRIIPAYGVVWPDVQIGRPAAVTVEYVAGYASISAIPPGVLLAIKACVAHWYKNRVPIMTTGGVPQSVPHSLDALLALHSHQGYS